MNQPRSYHNCDVFACCINYIFKEYTVHGENSISTVHVNFYKGNQTLRGQTRAAPNT